MSTKEIALTDSATTYDELQKASFFVSDKKFDYISVPLSLVNYVKTYLESTPKIQMAVTVDFPYGLEILDIRLASIIHAIRKGAQIIDIPINNNMVVNDNWKALNEDCKACYTLCNTKNVPIRFILDYRLFENEITIKICQILSSIGVDTVITTSGIGPDEPYDNIILAREIQEKTDVSVVVCSSMLQSKHIDMISQFTKSFGGYRLTSLGMAERLFGKIGV